MNKIIRFPSKRTLVIAQKCMLGFLNEYLKLIESDRYIDSVDLLKEEIDIVSDYQINDYDKEILNILNKIKHLFIFMHREELVNYVKKEIDNISKDLSISNS